jgi:hypothetical protein
MLTRLLHSLDAPIGSVVLVRQGGDHPTVRTAIDTFLAQQMCVRTRDEYGTRRSQSSHQELWKASNFVPPDLHCIPKAKLQMSRFGSVAVYHNDRNTGCSQAWNLVLRYAWRLNAPFAVLLDSDSFFPPGMLGAFHTFVNGMAKQRGFVSALTNEARKQPFSMFSLTRDTIRRAGLFDENIFPPYYENSVCGAPQRARHKHHIRATKCDLCARQHAGH